MKTTIFKIITSYKTTVILLLVYALTMAVATILEKFYGTTAAKILVYYSPVFLLIQLFLVVNFIACFYKRKLWKKKKWGFVIVHFAFIIILTGAMISHLFAVEGTLHLREGERSDRMAIQTSAGESYHIFPFSVELVKFTLSRYPGSSSPSAYESEVLVHVDGKTLQSRIFMNNILDMKGYRFFQASYDRDEKGTILSVNKDVAGRNVTYAGYLSLVIGLVLCVTAKNSRLRQLGRQLKELREPGKTTVVMFLLMFSFPALAGSGMSPAADAAIKQEIDPAHAAKFGSLPMQSYNGRMIPVNTFSSEVLRKIHRSDKINGLNSDQFLLSLLALPQMWAQTPVIALPSKELAYFYDLSEGYCSYYEMFDSNGNYKLRDKLDDVYAKKAVERNSFDKDLIKLDEKVNILHQLFNYRMLNIFPVKDDPNLKWYAPGDEMTVASEQNTIGISHKFRQYLKEVQIALKSGDWKEADEALSSIAACQNENNNTVTPDAKKIEAELKYNKMNIFRICKKCYLILGGILLILSFVILFRKNKWLNRLTRILAAAVLVVFHLHMMGMGARWYIGGHAPWSNSYETMVYVSWATIFAGLLFWRRSKITFALATLFGGVILFVSGLNWMDPQINPLVPVLKSPWLMFHVAVIVAAYGFFGISFLIGIVNLIVLSVRSRHIVVKELSVINEMSVIIGIVLMTAGTFLGAVWANESWGRYWGWDPKETWALITIVVYALVIHSRLVKKWDNPRLFNLISVLAFFSVLMTYFGVNYFLTGMHSYA